MDAMQLAKAERDAMDLRLWAFTNDNVDSETYIKICDLTTTILLICPQGRPIKKFWQFWK